MFDGVRLMKGDLGNPNFPASSFTFEGVFVDQGYGDERHTMSLRDYTLIHLYSRDFLSEADVSLGERKVGGGADLDPVFQDRPGSIFVDYYVPNRTGDAGMDWATLRLILGRYNDKWFLTDIAKKAWAP